MPPDRVVACMYYNPAATGGEEVARKSRGRLIQEVLPTNRKSSGPSDSVECWYAFSDHNEDRKLNW